MYVVLVLGELTIVKWNTNSKIVVKPHDAIVREQRPSYNWIVNGGVISSGQGTNSILVNWGSSGLGVVSLHETNTVGCDTTVLDTIYISGQQINSEILGQDTTCLNTAINYYTVSSPSLFYNWNVSGGMIVSGQSTNTIGVQWSLAGFNSISVQVFNSCGIGATIQDSILVGTHPIASIIGPDTVCQQDFTKMYHAGNNTSTFQWYSPNEIAGMVGADSSSVILGFTSSGMKSLGLIETNGFGCVDSTFKLINVLSSSKDTIYQVICEGQSYQFQGSSYSNQGVYSDTLQNSNNCDSIVSLNLSVLPVFRDTIFVESCFGDVYIFRGNSLNISGYYSDTINASTGCDSIFILDLIYLPENKTLIRDTICEGAPYTFAGQIIDSSGVYIDTSTAYDGCDSLIQLELVANSYLRKTIIDTFCLTESYFFYDTTIYSSGIYHHLIPQTTGCDSLITLDLFRDIPYKFTGPFTTCSNDLPFEFKGNFFNSNGVHRLIIPDTNNCDSIIEFFLFVRSSHSFNDSATICSGTSFDFRGQILTLPGNYTDSLISSEGCDSVYNFSLSVLPAIDTTRVLASICENINYRFNSQNLTQSGIYYDTLISNLGCDSITQLSLTVLQVDSTNYKDTICFGDTIPFFGRMLGLSGSYNQTFTNSRGCDSTVTLDLFVKPLITNVIDVTICSRDTFYFNNISIYQTGIYYDTLNNINSCDSIVALNLTVLNSVQTNLNETICYGDTFILNNRKLFLSGTYMDTLNTAKLGCDSIVTLTLNVDPVLNASVTVSLDSLIAYEQSVSYQWLRCDTTSITFTPIIGANSKIFIPGDSSYYAVEISGNNCVDTSSCYKAQLITKLENHAFQGRFILFPNPTNGVVTLQSFLEDCNKLQLHLYDLKGQRIDMQFEQNKHYIKFDLSHFPKGVYFMKIKMSKGIIHKRLIVQ